MNLKQDDIKRVKADGFLLNRGTENFSARIITENGVLSCAQLKNLSEAAEQYGNGDIAFTTRLTVELPGIAYENIEAFKQYVAKEGMVTGGTGAKVRPVTACKGTTCVFGLYDTQALAKEIHKRFFEGYQSVALPHKFKISVGGCPNNCMKPDLNDLGIVGQKVPVLNSESCKNCGKCAVETNCPMSAVKKDSSGVNFNKEICNNCGRCIDACPFNAVVSKETRYKVYTGGRWGKQIRIGNSLNTLFTHDELMDIIEKSILLFKSEGLQGERFGQTIDRIGIEKAEKLLMDNVLLQHKDEIIEKELNKK